MEAAPMINHMDDVESGGKYDFENDFAYRNNVANAPTKIRLGKQICFCPMTCFDFVQVLIFLKLRRN